MAYTKRDDIPVLAGETAFELDTGDLVAVSCSRKRVDQGMSYSAIARAINVDGTARLYPDGRPLQTEMKHAVSAERMEALTDAAITRDCLLAVLGEPPEIMSWPEVFLTSWNIRVSIAAAPFCGAADAGAVL